ncbi:MAG: DUF1840 domain-containing protein [Betaproteobacteria bacterium]|uniref:DUF1840 domain-containing protein n=1 Tax=Candidatus Proximibacter danicus TaxID=2954365 RepID=A0A9D7K4E6_9PROT|nr:DUF1840 domain-containing protein [Candidatus Proximibacter danicus]MBK9447231.1 DUF1840 domain-containing protein [Betaproteobacteria bacterium]
MLVKFTSNVAGELMMFADVAKRLLTVAGKECSARGVITFEQIPDIVARLQQVVSAEKSAKPENSAADDVEDSNVVSLGRRAQPFIEFLELTARDKEGFILWEAPQAFGN